MVCANGKFGVVVEFEGQKVSRQISRDLVDKYEKEVEAVEEQLSREALLFLVAFYKDNCSAKSIKSAFNHAGHYGIGSNLGFAWLIEEKITKIILEYDKRFSIGSYTELSDSVTGVVNLPVVNKFSIAVLPAVCYKCPVVINFLLQVRFKYSVEALFQRECD